eukprot:scaffold17715_cov30-Cyclotella_meneghiniana.AAC.1
MGAPARMIQIIDRRLFTLYGGISNPNHRGGGDTTKKGTIDSFFNLLEAKSKYESSAQQQCNKRGHTTGQILGK